MNEFKKEFNDLVDTHNQIRKNLTQMVRHNDLEIHIENITPWRIDLIYLSREFKNRKSTCSIYRNGDNWVLHVSDFKSVQFKYAVENLLKNLNS